MKAEPHTRCHPERSEGSMGAQDRSLALIAAFLFAAAIMAIVAWAAEKLVLRKLVNQEGIILFMATIGLTFFLEGLSQTLFGSDVYPLNLGLPKEPIFLLESLFDGGI